MAPCACAILASRIPGWSPAALLRVGWCWLRARPTSPLGRRSKRRGNSRNSTPSARCARAARKPGRWCLPPARHAAYRTDRGFCARTTRCSTKQRSGAWASPCCRYAWLGEGCAVESSCTSLGNPGTGDPPGVCQPPRHAARGARPHRSPGAVHPDGVGRLNAHALAISSPSWTHSRSPGCPEAHKSS